MNSKEIMEQARTHVTHRMGDFKRVLSAPNSSKGSVDWPNEAWKSFKSLGVVK